MAPLPVDVTLLRRLTACCCYGAISIMITLFNKAVFSVYRFTYPNVVTTYQIIVSIAYMLLLQRLRWMDIGSLSLTAARQVFPLTLFWWLYVVSGVIALRYLNVPMYSVFRRSTTLIVVGGEWLLLRKRPTPTGFVSILLMVAGAAIAGLTDLTYSLPGYLWVSVCAVSTAVYLLLIRRLKDRTGLSQSALLLYNNVLALPLMLGMLLTSRELSTVWRYPRLHELSFQVFLLVSASQAFLLNLCIFWCTTLNSPLATTVTGQMKDILTTGLGLFLFGDVKFDTRNVTGVCIGLLGGIAYSLSSYYERQKPPRDPAATREAPYPPACCA
ncbi:hypothetical protein WJX81_006926 [Elliptochloris bilobata]|uniref:Sugar phosphate transporter domain-containing protein n=1 Tax=Elliptochloris bilobata TaxID=381761 RepID=A0AAW1SDA2_9CHLO